MAKVIPSALAFAVDGQIDPRVVACLDEARAIRDSLAAERAALEAERQAPPEPPAPQPMRAQDLAEVVTRLEEAYQTEIARQQAAAIELAHALAARLVAEARSEPAALLAHARSRVPEPWLTLRVHPDLAHEIQQQGLPCAVVPDPGLTPGDVLIETAYGTHDARIRSELERQK